MNTRDPQMSEAPTVCAVTEPDIPIRIMGVQRAPSHALLGRVWELPELDTTNAAYLALTEALDCSLVTADRRIAAVEGLHCPVLVLAQQQDQRQRKEDTPCWT